MNDLPRQVVTGQIIEDTGLCQERFRVNGISVSVEMTVLTIPVLYNPVEISQVLLNLLSNAGTPFGNGEKWVKITVALEKIKVRSQS